ncbi:MAG: WXG100 family type VII secretion target [Microbacterium sp.]|jgi:early secretory antigenic target protein ESAT-6|uniref:ESAT-6-like protein n=2 Tax=Bacteria TaxID=2 RepID=A0A0F0LY51_9MICO|nr:MULTISPECIES: WXG100 family type VII secretion target [Microbacterium]MAL05960.1 WXG100 family type VII secretion target [Microbacterium sp.]MCK9913136.1 WXG100 family type VII secretion target [Microbacteriaceae bacterium K1510]KJL45145.1 hypothetical protein RR49_00077 [Microbacterium ginsengisoli]KQS01079.1 hypothetical protein ASF93_11395 [Microbacterium sp. Leaf347]KQS05793.1 hypothetical protein ASG00_08545 [Microbacterium sp. Leaf351]
MHDFSVDPLALEVSAAELRTESARIGAILAGLEQEVGRLEASWDGDARSAYQRAQRSWSATFSEMRDLLERIARAADQMSAGYVESDRASAKLFRNG